jgi:hypothetical protein
MGTADMDHVHIMAMESFLARKKRHLLVEESNIGSGETTLFWDDIWNGRILQNTYPQLMQKCGVKHEHTLTRFMTQQLALLALQTRLTGRDKRSNRYGED